MEHVGYREWRTLAKETGMDAKKLDFFLLDLESDLNIEILTSDTNLQAALCCSLASGLLLLSAFMLQRIPLFGGIERSDYCEETSVRLAAFVNIFGANMDSHISLRVVVEGNDLFVFSLFF